jgi:acetyl-CoA acetyltransferase
MGDTTFLSGKTAIAGIGATDFSKDSGRSELMLAVQAVQAACDDAGISPTEIDGLVTFTMDTNPEIAVARELGIPELNLFSKIHYGGGAGGGTILQAAMAVATGVADVVCCYRAFNERSGRRFGAGIHDAPATSTTEQSQYAWTSPYGLVTPASWVAMFGQRYLHAYGATTEAFGHVAVADRKHAANNPAAHFYNRPITMEDHQSSRWIVNPLRLLDCCQETDGGQAIIVTSAERARDLQGTPAIIASVAQGSWKDQFSMTSFYRPDDEMVGIPEMGLVARRLYEQAGIGPSDIQTAVLYDHFTPFVLCQLEEFGFCGRGEAPDFVSGGNIEIGGGLPVNTHGGQLGEAYLHGMNGIAEGVRQVRGTSVNQVASVEHVLVTAGTGVPTSGLVLRADH